MRPASARDPAPARPRLFVCLTPPRPARTGPALRAAFFVDPETDSPEPRSARINEDGDRCRTVSPPGADGSLGIPETPESLLPWVEGNLPWKMGNAIRRKYQGQRNLEPIKSQHLAPSFYQPLAITSLLPFLWICTFWTPVVRRIVQCMTFGVTFGADIFHV
ncbi:uncharacterized protein LOC144339564 [Macaca mulatta]